MSFTVFPNTNWKFKFNGQVGDTSTPVTIEGATTSLVVTQASQASTSYITLNTTEITTDYDMYVYYESTTGLSITDENRVIFTIKSTSPPTYFDTYELYMEDWNGEIATFSLDTSEIGKELKVVKESFVKTEDFNESYVKRVGVHVKTPKASGREFVLVINNYEFSSYANPTYVQPDEIMEFLGIVDNKGQPFKLSGTTVPSYNMVAKRIVEAENFVEESCRRGWGLEKRKVAEIKNADVISSPAYGYMGIYAGTGPDQGAQMFYTGIPIKMSREFMKPIDYSKGDLVEVRRYSSEWTAVPEDGIWGDWEKGIIFVKSLFFQKESSVRVTYRYGDCEIPESIKQAVILKTAMLIVPQDAWYRQHFPTMGENPADPNRQSVVISWSYQVKDLLRPYSNHICVGGI